VLSILSYLTLMAEVGSISQYMAQYLGPYVGPEKQNYLQDHIESLVIGTGSIFFLTALSARPVHQPVHAATDSNIRKSDHPSRITSERRWNIRTVFGQMILMVLPSYLRATDTELKWILWIVLSSSLFGLVRAGI
jgi:hypothetical protein